MISVPEEARSLTKEIGVFQFSIREMLWMTLVVAVITGWWMESHRASQWRQRAEIAAGQIEADKLGRMIFKDDSVVFQSLHYEAPLRETVFVTDGR